MRAALLLALTACYAPHAVPGSECAPGGVCPDGLMCSPANTCELPGTTIDAPVSMLIDSHLVDGCTPSGPELCGDGIDQDCDGTDPPCPANDAPADAIDVTAGGMFTANVTYAHDDTGEMGCAGHGGRDVFYKVVVTAPEVFYFDTFGSDFGTTIRVLPGVACTAAPASTPPCSVDACGGDQSQLALSLPTGTSCVIVDQDATATTGSLVLHVKRAGRDGTALPAGPQTIDSTSCSGVNVTQPSNACVTNDSKTSDDVAYFFTVCPMTTAMLDASTCGDPTKTHYDTVVYLRAAGSNMSLACVDDTATCGARPDRTDGQPDGSILANVAANGPNLFLLTIDGFGGACGAFELTTNLR